MGDPRNMEGNGSLLGKEHGEKRDLAIRTEESETETEYSPKNTYKNLLVLSISMTVVFTAYMSLQNLQSSLNEVAGLGVATLSCVYGGATLSCFSAPFLLDKIGYKLTLIISMTAHLIFVGANFHPKFYTLVPAGILVGLITGPIWISQGSVVTVLAVRHSNAIHKKMLAIVSKFSGIFFFFFLGSLIYGNVTASIILGRYRGNSSQSCDLNNGTSSNISDNLSRCNITGTSTNETELLCGIHYCPSQASKQGGVIQKPPKYLIYIMLCIFAAFVLTGILLVLFLMDNIKSKPNPDGSKKSPTKDLLKLLISPKMIPLMPILGFSGLEQAFMYGDFTQAFISCSVGVKYTGYAIACLGFTTAMAALIFGRLEKYFGITAFFIYAHLINAALMITMLFWQPRADSVVILFVITAFWGTADGIYQAGISAFLGHSFEKRKEAAFAVFRLVQSLAAAAGFAYSPLLCMKSKIVIALVFCAISWVGYMFHYFRYGRLAAEEIRTIDERPIYTKAEQSDIGSKI